jgi:hypothetical protein
MSKMRKCEEYNRPLGDGSGGYQSEKTCKGNCGDRMPPKPSGLEYDKPKNPFQEWMYEQGYRKSNIWYNNDNSIVSGRDLLDKKNEFDGL